MGLKESVRNGIFGILLVIAGILLLLVVRANCLDNSDYAGAFLSYISGCISVFSGSIIFGGVFFDD